MSTSPIRPLLLSLALAMTLLVSPGCDGGPDRGEPDATAGDTDTDADTDADADSDAEAWQDHEIDPHRIYEDVAWLAHDDRQGREPGTPGNEAAMVYVEELFAELGLEPVGDDGTYRQHFTYSGALPAPNPDGRGPGLDFWASRRGVDDELPPMYLGATGRGPVSTANVLGALLGTDPDISNEVIVVGGHIDHVGVDYWSGDVYNGADDNASGTAVVLELARAVVESGIEPARTIVFAAWNAEEVGLIGSCHYVSHPVFPIADTVAKLNFDMVGAGDGTGLRLYGGLMAQNRWLANLMIASAEEQGLPWDVLLDAPFDASDHVCFDQAGVPNVFGFSLGDHLHYHTTNDTIDTILEQDLQAAAELAWGTLAPLALGTEDTYLD